MPPARFQRASSRLGVRLRAFVTKTWYEARSELLRLVHTHEKLYQKTALSELDNRPYHLVKVDPAQIFDLQ